MAPRIYALVAALLLTAAVDLLAQGRPPVGPGDRVRLSAPSIGFDRVIATVFALKPDTLWLQHPEALAVPIVSITQLDVSRGQESRARQGSVIGLVGGAVIGAIIGIAQSDWGESFTDIQDEDEKIERIAIGALVGGIAGAALGALIGSTIRVDKWVAVPLHRLRVTVVPVHRSGLSVGVVLRV